MDLTELIHRPLLVRMGQENDHKEFEKLCIKLGEKERYDLL
jgi:hypothetical protein